MQTHHSQKHHYKIYQLKGSKLLYVAVIDREVSQPSPAMNYWYTNL